MVGFLSVRDIAIRYIPAGKILNQSNRANVISAELHNGGCDYVNGLGLSVFNQCRLNHQREIIRENSDTTWSL